MAAAKKTPAAKRTAKRSSGTPSKKPASAAKPRKTTAVKEKMNKTAILSEIADSTGLSKKDVSAVLDELGVVMERHLKKRSVGEFTLPGLFKIKTVKKPAQKARKNVPNPFRPGETMDIPAKPASTRVKVTPLKKLKEMAQQ